MRRSLLCLFVFLATPLVFAACSDDDRPAATGASSSSSSSGTSGSSGSSGSSSGDSSTPLDEASAPDGNATDANVNPLDAESPVPACQGFVREGPDVAEIGVTGSPPAPAGGSVVTGKYFLTQFETYGGSTGPTGRIRKTALIVSANMLQFATRNVDEGIDVPRSAESYQKLATTLESLEICPLADRDRSRGFTATGTTLTFIEPSGLLTRVSIYTKQ